MIKSIGFDLDGTLWDASEATAQAWDMTLTGMNLKIPNAEDVRGIMGRTPTDIVKTLLPSVDIETGLKLLDNCCDNQAAYISKNGGQLFEGLEEVLSTLSKKYKLFIVSNCQDGYIDCFLEYHKLAKYFCDYECNGRTHLTKGENIVEVMKRKALTSAVYVGDTQGDYDGAKFAGIPFIYAAYGFGKISEDVLQIQKITDLPKIVDAM